MAGLLATLIGGCAGSSGRAAAIAAATASPTLAAVGVGAPGESSSAIQHTLGNQTFTATNVNGTGTIPVFAASAVVAPHPGITRVVVIVHGEQRDAGQYYDDVTDAATDAGAEANGAFIVAPQFLNTTDVDDPQNAATLPSTTLGWRVDEYSDGKDAQIPAAVSAFDVLDDLVAAFTNRADYPNLQTIVIAGHSGGAQLVGRYAIVGTGYESAIGAGYAVRFVVASPSSFLYFDADRPRHGSYEPGNATACPTFNSWRYGFGSAPRYVGGADPSQLWQRFVGLNVTYLSGPRDTKRNGSIDQSCGAEDEGVDRIDRALKYYGYLTFRNGGTPIQLEHVVQGVGHDDHAMLTSAPAIAALFGP